MQGIAKLQEVGLTKEKGVLYNNLAATSLQTRRPAAALHYCTLALQVWLHRVYRDWSLWCILL